MIILIVGLGSIAQKHIDALRKITSDLLIYALRSNAHADKLPGIINIFDLSVIETIQIDFAIISNPTAYHKQTIKQLIKLHIPLFIEKPIFDTLEIGDLLSEIKTHNITTYVACNLRFLGAIKFVKEFIVDKRVNEVNCYCGSYLPDWRPGKNFRTIYSANKEMGGGVHIDLIHEIDYLYWLFGAPKYVSAKRTNNSSLAITAIDYANYLLGYEFFSVNVILNYYRRDAKRILEIVTEEGTIEVNLLTNKVHYNGLVVFETDKTILSTYEDQLRFFINDVVEKKIEFNTADEAFEILKLCLATD